MAEFKYPEALDEVIEYLKRLPGIGRRTAERLALAMLKWEGEKLAAFGEALRKLPKTATFCPECGGLAENGEPCSICRSAGRDTKLLCVVEDFSQVTAIENSGFFDGVYHVLGGKLSPLDNRSAADLNLTVLLRRLEQLEIREIILALSPDVEGQATAMYIANLLKDKAVKITRLAQGLPAGADISFADAATIGVALAGRRNI
ncbi:MAG: recombination mediator RecR [Victivallaceae bacterium]|nr:recombination mediator RecR [Victivallaceae bacterium]